MKMDGVQMDDVRMDEVPIDEDVPDGDMMGDYDILMDDQLMDAYRWMKMYQSMKMLMYRGGLEEILLSMEARVDGSIVLVEVDVDGGKSLWMMMSNRSGSHGSKGQGRIGRPWVWLLAACIDSCQPHTRQLIFATN